MNPTDIVAGAIFIACWIIYEPLLHRLTGGRGAINIDMAAVREAWVRRLMARENRIMDATLLGHLLNSATFFASTNLLVIAAASGLLFGGEAVLGNLRGLAIAAAPAWLIEVKIGLVVVTLSRGLLDFIWAIRQLNFCLALVGAAPDARDETHHEDFIRAATQVLSPAFGSFNKGVRAYYFALAAAAWIVSPWAMAGAVVATLVLLLQRQVASEAAFGLRDARRVLEAVQRRPD